jgi:hypothetical protein
MDNYALVINVQATRSNLSVYEHDDRGWLRLVWTDERRYSASPAVVTQVVCAALIALAGRAGTEDVARDLDELTADVW